MRSLLSAPRRGYAVGFSCDQELLNVSMTGCWVAPTCTFSAHFSPLQTHLCATLRPPTLQYPTDCQPTSHQASWIGFRMPSCNLPCA